MNLKIKYMQLTNYQKKLLFVSLEEFHNSEIRIEVKEKCKTLLNKLHKNINWNN